MNTMLFFVLMSLYEPSSIEPDYNLPQYPDSYVCRIYFNRLNMSRKYYDGLYTESLNNSYLEISRSYSLAADFWLTLACIQEFDHDGDAYPPEKFSRKLLLLHQHYDYLTETYGQGFIDHGFYPPPYPFVRVRP